MSGLWANGKCAECGKAIMETSPWHWTHYIGGYHCNDRDITDRRYAHPDRETIARVSELRRNA
jgi:hypothetical protein